ncbi:helix-turn-helix domain-containing protein [Eggerthellaceae bacterium zg-893]|nr:helix-turn-helix domain-containing protein [Eggerthellaceae bacterium zg-893]
MAATTKEVADCIRAERARRGWSRDQLSQRTGIPASTIACYETGKSRITLENAWTLADAFDMPLGALYGRDEERYRAAKKAS